MRRKERRAPIALGSLVVMVGLLAMGSFSPAEAEGTWVPSAAMSTTRFAASTSVVAGRIYAIGGDGPARRALSVVEAYDPATDTWTAKSEMPTARWVHSASVVDGRIYVIGGASDAYAEGMAGGGDPAGSVRHRRALP